MPPRRPSAQNTWGCHTDEGRADRVAQLFGDDIGHVLGRQAVLQILEHRRNVLRLERLISNQFAQTIPNAADHSAAATTAGRVVAIQQIAKVVLRALIGGVLQIGRTVGCPQRALFHRLAITVAIALVGDGKVEFVELFLAQLLLRRARHHIVGAPVRLQFAILLLFPLSFRRDILCRLRLQMFGPVKGARFTGTFAAKLVSS